MDQIVNLFEHTFCINLITRPDRKKWIEDQIDCTRDDFEFFFAILHENPKRGCLESHLSIIKEAKLRGYPNILILEDDAKIRRSDIETLVFPERWDMLYFGGNVQQILDDNFEHDAFNTWVRATTFSTHAYAINQTLYDRLIDGLQSYNQEIDVYYCTSIHPNYRCYICNPQIVSQRICYSDITGKVENYDIHMSNIKNVDYHTALRKQIISKKNVEIKNKIICGPSFDSLSMDAIYVINLHRRKDRLNKVDELLKTFNIKFTRWDAVDGLYLEPNLFVKDLFKINDFQNRMGVLGCALSHFELWKYLSSSCIFDKILIFEDDVNLCHDFVQKWKTSFSNIASMDQMWDIIYLGGPAASQDDPKMFPCAPIGAEIVNTPNIYKLSSMNQKIHPKIGAFSYAISKRGANKLISIALDTGITCAIDWFILNNLEKLNGYILFPSLVKSDVTLDSDIQFNFNKTVF